MSLFTDYNELIAAGMPPVEKLSHSIPISVASKRDGSPDLRTWRFNGELVDDEVAEALIAAQAQKWWLRKDDDRGITVAWDRVTAMTGLAPKAVSRQKPSPGSANFEGRTVIEAVLVASTKRKKKA